MPDIGWLLSRLGSPRAIFDVVVVTVIVYWLLWVAQGTRATQLIRGIVILIVSVFLLASALNLTTLNWLLARSWPGLVVALPVIFQPELRRALEQIGHAGSWLRTPFPTGSEDDLERTVDEIVRAAAQLARQRFGALVVIERETGLQDVAVRGVALDAMLSRQLLINIFFPNSPLHDAAVVVRGQRIVAASVVLPLTDNISASGQLGTRHRAAIGVTEESDALAVVVSEETGQIAVAHNGRLIRNLDQDRLRRVLRSLLRLDRAPTRTASTNGRIHFPGRSAGWTRRGDRARRRNTEPSKTS
ncbi:MAG: Diadenylate cyclase spyDAC; Bacterial checkpoint controller DisA with nucleotide-binding domain [uncultured Thermomicrobiales bacterium]|uniref:Diadenylate cyclase n=1 Tax=uncultured Thermomicrobiales bacterium TaxID=1645740 RepID=A0A6J4UCG3_9BACT|nr:MAG: Diadenylate cyclase spyDAC; Bacterial checkpoint controller DisA with nucleotide-binding domain [uncultured Thermomicrobiales bacterium]